MCSPLVEVFELLFLKCFAPPTRKTPISAVHIMQHFPFDTQILLVLANILILRESQGEQHCTPLKWNNKVLQQSIEGLLCKLA